MYDVENTKVPGNRKLATPLSSFTYRVLPLTNLGFKSLMHTAGAHVAKLLNESLHAGMNEKNGIPTQQPEKNLPPWFGRTSLVLIYFLWFFCKLVLIF